VSPSQRGINIAKGDKLLKERKGKNEDRYSWSYGLSRQDDADLFDGAEDSG
jgi:hypothetical protein